MVLFQDRFHSRIYSQCHSNPFFLVVTTPTEAFKTIHSLGYYYSDFAGDKVKNPQRKEKNF